MKQIYFMRHGLSEMNKIGLRSGSTNTPLTDEGREMAHVAGRDYSGKPFDSIITSTLDRAIETAQIVAKETNFPLENIIQSPLLVERHFGSIEAQPYVPDADTDDVPGIELTADLLARAQKAADLINALDGETILVVGHGGIGRALRHVLNPEIPFVGAGHFPNAQIFMLDQQ